MPEKLFFTALGVQVHPLQPLATSMNMYSIPVSICNIRRGLEASVLLLDVLRYLTGLAIVMSEKYFEARSREQDTCYFTQH